MAGDADHLESTTHGLYPHDARNAGRRVLCERMSENLEQACCNADLFGYFSCCFFKWTVHRTPNPRSKTQKRAKKVEDALTHYARVRHCDSRVRGIAACDFHGEFEVFH